MEAAEALVRVKQYQPAGFSAPYETWPFLFIGDRPVGEIDPQIDDPAEVERLVREDVAGSHLAAITRARRQYPVPSPIGEERLDEITDALEEYGTSWPPYQLRRINDLLAHIVHQDALIAFLASEGQDEAAMRKLKEAFGK